MSVARVLVALFIQDASHLDLGCVKDGSDLQWFVQESVSEFEYRVPVTPPALGLVFNWIS